MGVPTARRVRRTIASMKSPVMSVALLRCAPGMGRRSEKQVAAENYKKANEALQYGAEPRDLLRAGMLWGLVCADSIEATLRVRSHQGLWSRGCQGGYLQVCHNKWIVQEANELTVPERQGFVRLWAPCVSMLLLSLLSYADRSVLAILSPTILADLHMSATQYGYAVSAFSYCYMIANPVWGIAIDRRGVWVTIFVAVGVWSVASGAHALMMGLTGMCLARGVLGFGEGATFPAGLATVAETMPEEKRSFALGLAYSGGSLGAALAPLLITPIALHYGWRATFVLTMAMGGVWLVLWAALRLTGFYRANAPVRVAEIVERKGKWNRDLIATAAVYGLGAAPLAFGLYAAPLFLSRVLHVNQASLGHLLWIPPAGWETGYLFWGWISDRRKRLGRGRPTVFFAAFCVAGFLIALEPLTVKSAHPVLLTMVLFYLQMFIAGGFVVLSLADGMGAQPRENSGFLAGVAISSWAAVTGLLTPVLGHLFDRKEYSNGLWLVASLPVVGVLLWRLLRSSEDTTLING
jgi:ACS family hexuronate transporter-like MFS transporter